MWLLFCDAWFGMGAYSCFQINWFSVPYCASMRQRFTRSFSSTVRHLALHSAKSLLNNARNKAIVHISCAVKADLRIILCPLTLYMSANTVQFVLISASHRHREKHLWSICLITVLRKIKRILNSGQFGTVYEKSAFFHWYNESATLKRRVSY